MKIIFALIYIFWVSINTFALEEQRVTGFTSCRKTGDRSGFGSVEGDGLSIEAVFECKHASDGGQVVTKGSTRDFRPYAFEEAMNQATDSSNKLCHSDVKLIRHSSETSGCIEGVCTVNIHALFECLF